MLRSTLLALTGAIILWGILGVLFWRILGEVRCGGQSGLRPPIHHRHTQALPTSEPTPPLRLPWTGSPQSSPPQDQPLGVPTESRPSTPSSTPPMKTLRELGQSPSLGTGGSYPAVGCPHRHLPPGPRHLHIRPHLPAAARGSGAAPLLPCSAARTRLSGTGVWKGLRTGLPYPLDPPPNGRVPSHRLTPQGSAPGASLQATPPTACQTPGTSTQAMPLESLTQSSTPEPSIAAPFPLLRPGPRLLPAGPAPQVRLSGLPPIPTDTDPQAAPRRRGGGLGPLQEPHCGGAGAGRRSRA